MDVNATRSVDRLEPQHVRKPGSQGHEQAVEPEERLCACFRFNPPSCGILPRR